MMMTVVTGMTTTVTIIRFLALAPTSAPTSAPGVTSTLTATVMMMSATATPLPLLLFPGIHPSLFGLLTSIVV